MQAAKFLFHYFPSEVVSCDYLVKPAAVPLRAAFAPQAPRRFFLRFAQKPTNPLVTHFVSDLDSQLALLQQTTVALLASYRTASCYACA